MDLMSSVLTLSSHEPCVQVQSPVPIMQQLVIVCITRLYCTVLCCTVLYCAMLYCTVVSGCTCVVKPGEDTPLSTLALAALLQEAGLPGGVVNVVPCSRAQVAEVGALLCASPKVRR